MVSVWKLCRSGMGGYTTMPDAGGLMDQAAVMVDALQVMSAMQGEISQSGD